ncbi:hypothetical protein VNO77_25404 [Canavalia gladiata]|uniref:Uncharacterized protein n=1 Tax=Canavalia gladiata TaxID=3824 RepID=A0AAN9L8M7_CANGL
MDNKSLLKIWNLNKCGGVMGIFNCQGTGSWPGLEILRSSTGALTRLSKEESLDITLKVLHCDVFTESPIKVNNQIIQFAPIGLTNMYNSGGAVEAVESSSSSGSKIHIRGRGGGDFGAYSNLKPKSCSINSEDLKFQFREKDNIFGIAIPAKSSSWDMTICY